MRFLFGKLFSRQEKEEKKKKKKAYMHLSMVWRRLLEADVHIIIAMEKNWIVPVVESSLISMPKTICLDNLWDYHTYKRGRQQETDSLDKKYFIAYERKALKMRKASL